MLHRQQYIPASIRSLIRNLDAALTACDQLLEVPNSDPHNLLRFELSAIAHVLQARENMRELQGADSTVTSQITLFLAVTDCLEDGAARKTVSDLEGASNRLIGGHVPIGTLVALAAAMRDVLELCCTTFDEVENSFTPIVPETMVWATGPEPG